MKLKLEKKDGIDVVVYADCPPGWSRPASADECAMWARIVDLKEALREIRAFHPGNFRPLVDEIKIHEIACKALAE